MWTRGERARSEIVRGGEVELQCEGIPGKSKRVACGQAERRVLGGPAGSHDPCLPFVRIITLSTSIMEESLDTSVMSVDRLGVRCLTLSIHHVP